MKNKFKYCFFASSAFGCWVLKTIIKKYRPDLVATLPAKPAGRGLKLEPNAIFSLALKEKLPVIEIDRWEKLKDLDFDFGLVAGFGKIIPVEIFTLFKKGILNLHPSLLPKYRGANPIREPILSGDIKTGITLFVIDKDVDTGPILAQQEFELKGNETIADLEIKLGQIAGNLFNETIEKYLDNAIKLIPQNNSEATDTKKISKSDGLLKIEENYEIWDRKIRAFQGFPTAYIKIRMAKNKFIFRPKNQNEISVFGENAHSKFLKIFKIEKLDQRQLPKEIQQKNVGQFFQWRNELGLRISNSFIIIKELQLQDKKRITSKEFLNGYNLKSINIE